MSDSEEMTGKKKTRPQRNPEGEAQAQFRDEDFDFGSKKKQMATPQPHPIRARVLLRKISGLMQSSEPERQHTADYASGNMHQEQVGSDGQIINLDEQAEGGEETKKKQFKASIVGTQQKEGKWMMSMLDTQYTVFEFKIWLGSKSWVISKRFSDFDKLDNRLNDKFGLPPVGLPPKKWFGLDDAELIQLRQKVLLAYIQDCLKRPVLIHSRELQQFTEMPDDVVEMVTKGGR